ncbi:MAG TPA: adenylate/guanylate cyclase domain-containing protein [Chitinophagaceae bacterium]|nr:adenylate/guanylate cyclase domain-containing protein [Chitinophagaceae bacterium]
MNQGLSKKRVKKTNPKALGISIMQEENKRFQVICSSKNDAIITSDESKLITFWNKGAESIFGYTAEEAVGKPMTLIIPNQYQQRHNDGIERMNQRKKPRAIGKVLELSAVRKNGEEFPIELTLGSWDSDGKRYYSGIIRDISAKKKAEKIMLEDKRKIEEQNKRFQVICSSKNDAIITSDESKLITFWNKGAENIFGYTAEEAVGKPMTLIIPMQYQQRHNDGIERMNQRKKPRVIGKVLELSAVRKNGEEFPIELTLGSWDSDGKRYYSGIIRDISAKKKAEKLIIEEKKKSDELLLNILPKLVADELKNTGIATAKNHKNVTILFSDFEGFTTLASSISAAELVKELNEIFGQFDDILESLSIEKIKTIGDAYFAACGLPEKNTEHAERCIEAAKQMFRYLEVRNKKTEIKWKMRVGIHSGPVMAGVVSKKKYAYDLFGDTVNIASRMESNGEVGKINISESTYQLIKKKYKFTPRGHVKTKGKGELKMYFVD